MVIKKTFIIKVWCEQSETATTAALESLVRGLFIMGAIDNATIEPYKEKGED
jgi:hypothetical protein